MVDKILTDFLFLWATIDPIGTLAIFASLTAASTNTERRRIATKAILYSAIILISSIVVGQLVLTGLGIQLISLQVAGGIILLIFGLQMVFGATSKLVSGSPEEGHDAIMAVILLTDNQTYSLPQQGLTTVVVGAVLGITWLLMMAAGRVHKIIGDNGAAILVRIMGMILVALSVELIMEALGIAAWLTGAP
jgi:multiple antibiotic resistance protein